MRERKSKIEGDESQTEEGREQESEKKKTCQCSTGTGKKLDETNGPSVTAHWMDASRQAKDKLYCIRRL